MFALSRACRPSALLGLLLALGCVPSEPPGSYRQREQAERAATPDDAADAGELPANTGSTQGSAPLEARPSPPLVELDGGGATEPASPPAAGGVSTVNLVASLPPQGERGVSAVTPLELRFSGPVKRSTVEHGLSSESLPLEGVTFEWDERNERVALHLGRPLELAGGGDVASVQAKRYELRLTGAEDESGRVIPDIAIEFFTLRRIDTVLLALADAVGTGTWRSDDVYGAGSCNETGNRICVGDSATSNAEYRGFLRFDVSALRGVSAPEVAELAVDVTDVLGTPFTDLGPLRAEELALGPIGAGTFRAGAAVTLGAASGPVVAPQEISFDLRPDLARAVALPSGIWQVRLRFTAATDVDGATDLLFLNRGTPRLKVRYLVP